MPKITALRLHNKTKGLPSDFSYSMDSDNQYELIAHPNKAVFVKDLYDAYVQILHSKGISPMSYDDILRILGNITYSNVIGVQKSLLSYAYVGPCSNIHLSNKIQDGHAIVTLAQFNRIKSILGRYDSYKAIRSPLYVYTSKNKCRVSNTVRITILIQVIEFIAITLVILAKKDTYPLYLILARSSAVIILLNSFLLLAHVSNIKQWFNVRFIHAISTNSYEFFHRFFGFKILLGSLLHTIGHLLHVNRVLSICRQGCSEDMVLTVYKDDLPVVISWKYFFLQPAYYTGWILVFMGLLIMFLIILQGCKMIRVATFYNTHRFLSMLFFVIIILHGLQQLLGLNLSYVFVLPVLLIYLYTRRHELGMIKRIQISKWHITDTMVRLYIINPDEVIHRLKKCIALSIFINHPKVSRCEWHPFTLSSSIDKHEGSLNIKINGKWTKTFVEKILMDGSHQVTQTINIGHITESCFRFYKFYSNRIFFCSGIGITPFLTIMNNIHSDDSNLFIWSTGNIELIKEFEQSINNLASHHQAQILIFYSNSARQSKDHITDIQIGKYNFLQMLVHNYSDIDIVHGAKLQVLTLLERINPTNIISRVINKCNANTTVGVFVCGSPSYSNSIRNSVNQLQKNHQKVAIDLWVEHL